MTQPARADLDDPRTAYLLGIADDELVIGHRHSHWTGVAPSLEEDLAFSTIAQDEINHADVWYQLLVGEERNAVDRLGLGRAADEYRHAVLCERGPGDFAYTLARQFLYDHFDAVRLESLVGSADADVAATARRLRHEERYHLLHADEWLRRLAAGGDEAHRRLGGALACAWGEALWLFESTPGEAGLVSSGVVPTASAELVHPWLESVQPILDECGQSAVVETVASADDGVWRLPEAFFDRPGGRHGDHTEDWSTDVWPEMTALHRSDPSAVW